MRYGKTALVSLCLVYLALPLLDCDACSVPVFRYALERWPADVFEVVVFHRGKLSPEHQAVVKVLEEASWREGTGNYALHVVDLDGEVEDALRKLWEEQKDAKPPWLLVRHPLRSRIPLNAWSSALTADAAKTVLDSPLRRQVAERILRGEVATWVLLESGDKEKDDAAAALLTAELRKLEETLELPEQPDYGYGETTDDDEGEGEQQSQVSFSTLRLSRTDAKEKFLLEMLLNSEEDLRTFSEPMCIPIFGRGRALFALVGKGINADNMLEACAFLCGPCSCQAKHLNPGTDLLMCVDWDGGLAGELLSYTEVAPLTGLPISKPEPKKTPETVETDATPPTQPSPPSTSAKPPKVAQPPRPPRPVPAVATQGNFQGVLLRNTIIALAACLCIMAAAAVFILRRGRSPRG